MNSPRHWALFFCLAAALGISPSHAQDAATPADEPDVIVENEPGRPGIVKITYICRERKIIDKEKGAGKPSFGPVHTPDCERDAVGFKKWGYSWVGTGVP